MTHAPAQSVASWIRCGGIVALALVACASGPLPAQEAAPTRGDDLAAERQVAGIDVPLDASPLEEVELESPDGVDLRFFWRRPPGDGPFPTILFLHGGGKQAAPARLKRPLLHGAVETRFLDKGFAVVACTRRPFWTGPEIEGPVGFDAAVDDTVRIVAKVRTLPKVDGRRITLYGGSGGGILGIVAASRTDLAGVVAGEPATVVPLDPERGAAGGGPRAHAGLMEDPHAAYVGQRREAMRAWMGAVRCPVLVLQGKAVGLHKVNTEILVPELRSLGKDVVLATYPDVTHGFYWGNVRTGATPELVDRLVRESIAFMGGTR